jgi:hypothetical protein
LSAALLPTPLQRRLNTTLHEAYGDAAWQLMPLSFALPAELPQWRAWIDQQAAANRDPGPWMLKTAQHLGKVRAHAHTWRGRGGGGCTCFAMCTALCTACVVTHALPFGRVINERRACCCCRRRRRTRQP